MRTIATGIGFGNNWFNAVGSNQYETLMGTPSTFAFNSKVPGSIVNAGQLGVGAGQNLTLVGGTVVSTGQLIAPKGSITVAAVPGESVVRITQTGNLLSLDVPVSADLSQINPLSLPQLLTGSGSQAQTTGVSVNNVGQVVLTGAGISVSPGDVVANTVTARKATLSAASNITTNAVNSAGNLGGGKITLESTVGNLDTSLGEINSSANNGNGGAIALTAEIASVEKSPLLALTKSQLDR